MVTVYNKDHYIKLAQSVLAGFPMEEAQKILTTQREIQDNESQEPAFWLELKKSEKSDMTTIQVSKSTKDGLEKLKDELTVSPYNKIDSYEKVILQLMIQREMRLVKNEAIEEADKIVIKIKECKDIKEHTELIDELYCYIDRLIDVGHHLETRIVAAKALEYLEFGFASMEGKIQNCAEGQRYDCPGTEEYNLFDEYFQWIGNLKDDSIGYYNHCRK